MGDALVIGYGNDLRRDDGAGRWVVDRLRSLDLPGVDVRSVHQLTPELALDASAREVVVFVDADVSATAVRVRPVEQVDPVPGVLAHHTDPAALLAMVPAVGERPSRAHVVSIPAADLGIGTELTDATAAAAAGALRRVLGLLADRAT